MEKLMSVFFAAAFAGAAWAENSADVLVWYVDVEEDQVSHYDGGANSRQFDTIKFWAVDAEDHTFNLAEKTYTGPDYLLVDGYNIIPVPIPPIIIANKSIIKFVDKYIEK